MRFHRLDVSDLTALASGVGGSAVLQELSSSRVSTNLLLFKFVCDQWVGDRQDLADAIRTLAEAQARDPQVFAELMGDPMVGAWLARTIRSLREPGSHAPDLSADLLQVGGLAAAAAIRLGMNCEVTSYARRSLVTFPGVGEVVLPHGLDGWVRIAVADGGVSLLDASGHKVFPSGNAAWRKPRQLNAQHAGLACTVRIEDSFPYRDCYHAPVADRLTTQEAANWQELFTDSWELICQHIPHHAPEISALLRTVVPLVHGGPGESRSCTSRDAVAAIGLTLPPSAADFAVTLIHEVQHSKLTSAAEIVPLYADDGPERHFAPWKEEPRPTAGLFQGVYAFLGVADAWSSLRSAPELAQLATRQFAVARTQVREGLDSLRRSTELTHAGEDFVAGMSGALQRLLTESLPEDVVALAEASVKQRRATWTLRHADRVDHVAQRVRPVSARDRSPTPSSLSDRNAASTARRAEKE